MTILHYIFDPLCGWCYGAAPLISIARDVPGLTITLHSGGMMAGDNRQLVTPQLRSYVMSHDERIAQLSGQPFGAAYFDGLLRDTGAMLDSAPPTTAILAAEDLAGRGLDMLHRLQRAHYVEGRRIAKPAVLAELAQELGLDASSFADTFARLAGAPTEQHFVDSRNWLARIRGQGFPSIALENPDGSLEIAEVGAWLGRSVQWKTYLLDHASHAPHPARSEAEFVCGPDGCAM